MVKVTHIHRKGNIVSLLVEVITGGNPVYVMADKTITSVYEDLTLAKKNAYRHYESVDGYALSHVADNTENATKNHYVIK